MNDKESLGKYLQREREARNISLREVATHTRVREYFLKALEEDQYHLLPSVTYVKGFLLTYAKYIGLDVNDVLLRYESSLNSEPVIHTEVPSEKKTLWNRKYLLTIGGTIAVCLMTLFFIFYLSKPPVVSIPPPSPPPPPSSSSSPPPPAPQPTGKTSVPEEKPFSLQLKAVEVTWVSIQVDDQPGKEILFKPKEESFQQGLKQIRLIVGNAGGLDLIFNGSPLERFGKSGEVVTLIFTPKGVEVIRH